MGSLVLSTTKFIDRNKLYIHSTFISHINGPYKFTLLLISTISWSVKWHLDGCFPLK